MERHPSTGMTTGGPTQITHADFVFFDDEREQTPEPEPVRVDPAKIRDILSEDDALVGMALVTREHTLAAIAASRGYSRSWASRRARILNERFGLPRLCPERVEASRKAALRSWPERRRKKALAALEAANAEVIARQGSESSPIERQSTAARLAAALQPLPSEVFAREVSR